MAQERQEEVELEWALQAVAAASVRDAAFEQASQLRASPVAHPVGSQVDLGSEPRARCTVEC